MMKKYAIGFEVAGEMGMFRRPDSGSDGCSSVIPTPSAALGMVESVARVVDVDVHIVAIGVCFVPKWTNGAFNSHSPIRKSSLVSSGNSLITRTSVLHKPRYQILATLSNRGFRSRPTNNAHAFQEIFLRRLRKGQSWSPVCLGLKKFMATDVDFIKTPIVPYNETLPYQIVQYFDHAPVGDEVLSRSFASCGRQVLSDFKITDGVAYFGPDQIRVDNGLLSFADESMQLSIDERRRK